MDKPPRSGLKTIHKAQDCNDRNHICLIKFSPLDYSLLSFEQAACKIYENLSLAAVLSFVLRFKAVKQALIRHHNDNSS